MKNDTYSVIDLILKEVASWHDFAEFAVENDLRFLFKSLHQSYHVLAKSGLTDNLAPLQEVIFKEILVEQLINEGFLRLWERDHLCKGLWIIILEFVVNWRAFENLDYILSYIP